MTRRYGIGVLLITLLAAALLAPAAQGAAPVELTIAHAMTGGADRDAFNRIVAAFQALYPDIRVQQVVQDDDLYEDVGLITMLRSDDPPDIYFQWGGHLVARDAQLGYAADLTDVLQEAGWADWFVDAGFSTAAGTVYNGRIYMIPNSLDVTTALWYNTDLFDQYGLEPPQSWDDLVEISRTLSARGVTPIVIGNNELWPLGNWAGHIVARAVGMDLLDAALRLEQPFNQPAFVEAFGLLEELAEAGAFNRDMQSLGADPAMNVFFQGGAAMHPIGSWLVSNALEAAPDDLRYSVFNTPPIPGGKGDQESVIGLATGFMVSASTPHFDEAIAFLRFFMASLQIQATWTEAGTFSPIRGAMEVAGVDPHTQELARLFEEAGEIVPPPDTGYPVAVADTFYQGAAFVAAGARSPEDALAWIDAQLAPLRAEAGK